MIKKFSFKQGSITIDFSQKRVSSLIFKNEEMIEGNIPFFVIKLRDPKGNRKLIAANQFEIESIKDDKAYYSNEKLDVILSIIKRDNSLVWNISVKNKTDLLIEQVELMSIGVCPKLIEEGGKGEIDIPYNEGARITSYSFREASAFNYKDVDYPSHGVAFMYPNMISSPFIAYAHKGTGIYLAMLDKDCTPKHIDFHVIDNCLKLEMNVFANTNYGEDYQMNFESVMTLFDGNYYDACELYRSWFYKNVATNYKTIKERKDELPAWYHESPVVLTYPVVGKRDSDLEMKPGGLYPYTNGLPVVDYYAEKLDAKIMVVLMQWESTAPWAPPYVWPPYGDVDNFFEYRDKLHENGHYLGVYTSGFGWTNKSYRRDYDKTDEFIRDNIKDIVCTNTDGSMKSYTVCDIRLGYDVCPACEKSKELFVDEANKMIDARLDYVQILDQNHGGNPYFCFSDKHGHVPAPGKWQVEETLKLLRRIDKKTCLLGCESAASEPYIQELMFSDNRYILNYCIGEPIPMYSYIYHEYVNNFMGNQICYALTNETYSYSYRVAYSFICGDMSTIIIDGEGRMHIAWCNETIIDDTEPLALMRNLNKWRLYFADHLHYGKMIKPLEYKSNKKHFGFTWGVHDFYFDAVLSTAFTNGKDDIQFFVNYDNKEEIISLNDKEYLVWFKYDAAPRKIKGDKIIVPPLSAIAIKIN